MTRTLCGLLISSTLLFVGCAGDSSSKKEEPAPAATSNESASAGARVYGVACGCSIAEVGHCGNYAMVDGAYVQITGDVGLGSMAFCGKEGLEAEIEGEVTDGKLQATSLKLVE